MKKNFAILLALVTVTAFAQRPIDSLVHAERAFAQLSRDKGTKEAFLSNLSDNGLIFRSTPVNGKEFWQQQNDEDESMLVWEPVFANIAASGDFGYTTGPFKQFQNKMDEQPIGTGSYISVWKKEHGEWKVVLDIGIGHPVGEAEIEKFIEGGSKKSNNPDAKKEVWNKETEFIQQQNINGWSTYSDYISENARIYRPQSAPYSTDIQRKKLFKETDKKFTFENSGGDIASSGDMAYMYGKTKIELTREGNTKMLNGNYLRIWKKENGEYWKIVVDLVNVATK